MQSTNSGNKPAKWKWTCRKSKAMKDGLADFFPWPPWTFAQDELVNPGGDAAIHFLLDVTVGNKIMRSFDAWVEDRKNY